MNGNTKLTVVEARRICFDDAARRVWKSAPEDLSLGMLDDIIAAKRASRNLLASRQIRNAAVKGAPFIGLATAFGMAIAAGKLWEQSQSIAFVVLAVFANLAILVLAFLVVPRLDEGIDDELWFAERLRQDLERERLDLRSIRAFAAQGREFVLFLRGFEAETSAVTQERVSFARDLLEQDRRGSPARTPAPSKNLRDLELDEYLRGWSSHLALIERLHQYAPVITLGNIDLPDTKRAELDKIGVLSATLIKNDWWTVFVELAKAAALVVAYFDQPTPIITRELDHLSKQGHPTLVVINERARIHRGGQKESFVENAPNARQVHVFGADMAPLETAIKELRG